MKTFKTLLEALPFGPEEDLGPDDDTDAAYVKISHSLLLRMFEFHENSAYNTDEDLHEIAELLFDRAREVDVVDMSDYDYIIGNEDEDEYDEFTEETKTADQIKREIVSKHAGHFPQGAQDYIHKSKTYGTRAINHLIDNHGIKPGHAKAALDKIKDDMSASFSGPSKALTQSQRVGRHLSQKWIGPRR